MSYLFDYYAGIYDSFMMFFDLQNTEILESFLVKPPRRILDVGGGTGVLGSKLQKMGYDVLLLDSSKSMLRQAKKRNAELKVHHSYLKKELMIKQADVIICRDCLHHLGNPQIAIKTMLYHLKKEGILYIHEFNPTNWKVKLLFFFERCCFEKIQPIACTKLNIIAKNLGCNCQLKMIDGREYICTITKT